MKIDYLTRAKWALDILHKPIHSITGAAVVIGATTLASGLLGIIRDRLLASIFGAGDTLDAYYAAFRLPDFLFMVIVLGGLSAGFIPQFLKHKSDSDENAWKFTSAITNFLGLILIALSLFIFIFAPLIIKIITPGFSQEKLALTILITRVLCASPVIMGISNIFLSAIQAQKKFFANAIAPVLYNLGIISGTYFFHEKIGIFATVAGVIFGAILHLLSQFAMVARAGYQHKFFFAGFKNSYVKEFLNLIFPRLATILVFQVQSIAFIAFGSTLVAGSVAKYQFATNLYFLPSWIFGLSFAIAAFPTLTDLAIKKDIKEFILQMSFVARQMFFFIIPVSVTMILLRTEIVRVVLGAGKFDWTATRVTADTLGVLVVSMIAAGIYHLFVRAFYAYQDTSTPFKVSIFSAAAGIISAIFLIRYVPVWTGTENYAILGVAGGFVVSHIVAVIGLWLMLRKKFGVPEQSFIESSVSRFTKTERSIIMSVIKICIGAGLGGLATQFIKIFLAPFLDLNTFTGVLLRLITGILAAIAVYALSMAIMKSPELEHLSNSLQKKWLKVTDAQEIETLE